MQIALSTVRATASRAHVKGTPRMRHIGIDDALTGTCSEVKLTASDAAGPGAK